MKKIFKLIFRIVLIIVLISIVTMIIDLVRVNNNKLPIFNLSSYDSRTSTQYFKGIIYNSSRKIKADVNENLYDSTKIKFDILGIINIKVNKKYSKDTKDYNFTYNDSECESKLYYADYDIKVYTTCIDDIKLNNKDLLSLLKSTKNIMSNIENSMIYNGTKKDIMMFVDDTISLYHCDGGTGDYYIGPKDMNYQDDFCTSKDDDFKFLAKVKEELPAGIVLPAVIETFYEDENYLYQFSQTKSNYVFVVVDAVRGNNEKKISVKEVLEKKLLTIAELKDKGLVFEKVEKSNIDK